MNAMTTQKYRRIKMSNSRTISKTIQYNIKCPTLQISRGVSTILQIQDILQLGPQILNEIPITCITTSQILFFTLEMQVNFRILKLYLKLS